MKMSMEIFQPIKLRYGAGSGDPRDGLCLMQMVDWFSGSTNVSDQPACASPVLARIGIWLNDRAPSQEARDGLWPLVWHLLGSRDPDAERARCEHIVREIVHRSVAPLFREIGLRSVSENLARAQSMSDIRAAADAARAAAHAFDAVCAAAYAAAWRQMRAIFVEAIALGKHGEADPAYLPRACELRDLLAAE